MMMASNNDCSVPIVGTSVHEYSEDKLPLSNSEILRNEWRLLVGKNNSLTQYLVVFRNLHHWNILKFYRKLKEISHSSQYLGLVIIKYIPFH